MENFEVCARIFIIKNNQVLLCRRKDKDYFFIPGGHIEFGEKTEETLKREIQEEIGLDLKISEFIGMNENYYSQDGENHHEFNVIFSGEIKDEKVEAKEDHLVFEWKEIDLIHKEKIYPKILQKKFIEWVKNKKIFWSSQF